MRKPFFILFVLGLFSFLFLFGCAKPSSQNADTVTVQYLYADWCHYCNQTSQNLNALLPSLNDGRLTFVRLNEAERTANSTIAQIYSDYKSRGVFGGFPTLVSRGPKGESSLVGYQPAAEVKAWICAQYVVPPKGCG